MTINDDEIAWQLRIQEAECDGSKNILIEVSDDGWELNRGVYMTPRLARKLALWLVDLADEIDAGKKSAC